MSGGTHRNQSTSSSLDEYERFFDAHNTFEQQRSSSSLKLPIGEEHEAPSPYERESSEVDFAEHHSAAYYPHAHQTLRSSESRRKHKKGKEKSVYKSKKGSRPSQLFQPSLDEVAEQDHEHRTTDDDRAVSPSPVGRPEASMYSAHSHLPDEHPESVLTRPRAEPQHDIINVNANAVASQSAPGMGQGATHSQAEEEEGLGSQTDSSSQASSHPLFTLGTESGTGAAPDVQDGAGGARLALPKYLVPQIQVNQSAPSNLQTPSPSEGPVKFSLGGDGSSAAINEQYSSPGNVIQSRPYPSSVKPMQSTPKPDAMLPGQPSVQFILGAPESMDNIQKTAGQGEAVDQIPTLPESPQARRHSVNEEATNKNEHAIKGRSYSYAPGDHPLASIRCRGSDVELADLPNRMMNTITSPEEAAVLNKQDLEELATHRFEHLRGFSKHKINKRSAARLTAQDLSVKPVHDLTPHELFVELDELTTHTHDETTDFMEWKEKARWIKFEEDVLDTSERWGRPHVASLSFHSLIELRRLLENGLVTLDVEIHDYVNMMQTVVDLLVVSAQLPADQKEYVMQALVLRHSHLDGKAKFSRTKSYGNLRGLESMSRHSKYSHIFGNTKSHTVLTMQSKHKRGDSANMTLDQVTMQMPEEVSNPLIRRNSRSYEENLDREQYNMELLKKIPQGAEVASVLVGTLKDLKKPCVAFLRLSQGVMLDHVAEVPLPIRFLFVCIGPSLDTVEYLEIGRSLSTLMSNKHFREAAYGARHRQAILSAMNAFLDDSMVLPPGDFDRKTLLPIMHMAKKKLRERKEKERLLQESLNAGKPLDEDEEEKLLDDPLRRTGRPFGGLMTDIRRKIPHYLSDIKDGCNGQVIAAFIFIYFACLSPAITFGGLLGEKTDNYMGASEMLMATSVTGILFSLLSGQPLLITGFTGPNMVFEEGIYMFSKTLDIDYLAWRFWIGVWIFVFALIMIATEAAYLVKYVTRFTEEIFAFLISMIFIYEVLVKLIKVFGDHPLCDDYDQCIADVMDHTVATLTNFSTFTTPLQTSVDSLNLSAETAYNYTSTASLPTSTQSSAGTINKKKLYDSLAQPNTALLTMTFTVFTFVFAYFLKGMRNKKVLGRTIRRALGDFGVPLSILLMCVLDYVIGDRVYTQKLAVPPEFSVSAPEKRGWLVNPLGKNNSLPVGHIFSAIIPALLGSILIFMESLIAGMIVDKKENKLRKGSGYHLDVIVLGFSALLNGSIGVPFVCAATVRTVAHTSALTVISKSHAPGEHPQLEKVIEQRVSNFLVHVLIGASMFLGMVLRYIPTAVLFGVFLYMGIASLGGIQLYQRMILLLTPTKHHPLDLGYVRFVRARKMHLFTIIQVFCVGLLWAVKLSPAALAFPFVLIILIPIRLFLFKYIFSEQELHQLDSEDDCKVLIDTGLLDDDLDFYDTAHMPD